MEMHTKEPLLLAEPPLNAGPVFSGVPLSQASTRSDNENYGDAAVQMRPWPDMHKQQGLGALSDCRGASTSQMPVYASIWDQPESMPLHKHAYPFQMNHPRDNASTVSALQRSCSGLDRTPGLSQNIPPDVGDTVGLERDHVMSLVDPGPVMLDELSSLNSDDSFASPLQRRPTHQQQSLFVTSRRNSRALPNPIQPPMAIHVRKPSTDPQSLKDQDPSQEFVHNGFVPGYSIWTSGDSQQAPEKPSKMVQGYLADIRTDIQSQRRKSESVLYDLDMTNPMHADRDSIYQQGVNPITAPTFRAFMSTSARSVYNQY
ncbi:hypothetical protein BGX31_011699 [Mortierella sp. GBA43]|nr:hypothetical protein BGX31_011699 [Mortierella sp. GBA43]